jgi:Flp pilus assembly protein TadD
VAPEEDRRPRGDGGLTHRSDGASRGGDAARHRHLVVFCAAAAIVVVIALVVGWLSSGNDGGTGGLQGPLVSAVTGSTDHLTPDEASTGLTLAPATGRIQSSEAEWTAILPKLERIAAADPGDENAQRKLALAYYNLDRLDEAAAIYQRLLLVKEDPVLRNRLGNTQRDRGDAVGAEAAYRKAIADDPTLAPPYLNLAELLWRQGKDDEALALLEQGLAAVPAEGRATLEQGRKVLGL